MDAYLHSLQAYLRFDPDGWVALYRVLSLGVALALCSIGLVLVFFGGGRLFRAVACPLGAVLGLVCTERVLTQLQVAMPSPRLPHLVAAVLAVVGLLFPPAILYLVVAVPVALLSGLLAGPEQYLVGFIPGFLVGGLLALLLRELMSALLASAVGAWLLTIGALAALRPHLPGPVQTAALHPWALLLGAGLLALAGAVLQSFVFSPRARGEEEGAGPRRSAGARAPGSS